MTAGVGGGDRCFNFMGTIEFFSLRNAKGVAVPHRRFL